MPRAAGRRGAPERKAGRPGRPRRIALRIALLGILFQAMVPNYAMAAAAARNPGLMPICSTTGIVWVQLDEEAPASAPAPAPVEMPGDKPCHFCVSATKPYALQSASAVDTVYDSADDAAPQARTSPETSDAWPGPRTIRAPPGPGPRPD